jgi:replicative DNA helicase
MSNEFEIEQSLLGGLMKLGNDQSDISNFVLNNLKTNSFYTRVHGEIYKAIKFLAASNMMFDQLSVASYLSKNSNVDIFDVDRCYSFHCDGNLLRQYTNTIKSAAIERYAIAKINDLQDIISDSANGNITQRIGLAESVISGILDSVDNRKNTGLRDGTEVANEWIDEIEAFSSGNNKSFDLGIQGLDEVMMPKGIKPGSLIVVGARPKMGKTFFATKVACHYLLNRDQGVSIFSLEMRAADIWERMLSEKTKSNSNNFYTIPMENNAYWDDVGHDNVALANTKIAICDTPGTTIRHIKSEVRKQHRKHKQGLIIVDYLTLMESDEKQERNDLKYGEITKQLKMLAKELGCVVLLLTQLNRGLESRPDKRPFPADSRDTGQIEQDCDAWIGLYREKVYNEDVPYNFTEAIIRLNRTGGTGTGYLTLENGYFEDVPTLEAQTAISAHTDKVKKDNDQQSTQFSGRYKK